MMGKIFKISKMKIVTLILKGVQKHKNIFSGSGVVSVESYHKRK